MENNTQRCPNCASLEAQNVLLDAKLAELEQSTEPVGHWSDCAVHSEPAYPKGECDCGGFTTPPQPQEATRQWVGLTIGETAEFVKTLERGNFLVAIQNIEAKLKSKNI